MSDELWVMNIVIVNILYNKNIIRCLFFSPKYDVSGFIKLQAWLRGSSSSEHDPLSILTIYIIYIVNVKRKIPDNGKANDRFCLPLSL